MTVDELEYLVFNAMQTLKKIERTGEVSPSDIDVLEGLSDGVERYNGHNKSPKLLDSKR